MLFTAFSVGVSAESVDVPDYEIKIDVSVTAENDYSYLSEKSFTFSPRNNSPTSSNMQFSGLPNGNVDIFSCHTITPKSDDVLIKKGKSTDFILENAFYCLQLLNGSTTYAWTYYPGSVRLLLFYANGEFEYITNYKYEVIDHKSNYYFFEFTPKYDVIKVELQNTKTVNFPFSNGTLVYYAGQTHNTEWILSLEQEDEKTGLLKSIIEWLKGIKNGITDLFDSIKELPSKIWSFIENGLKSLFVPSEEFLTGFKTDMEDMLREKLGAVYQVIEITLESWDSIMNSDKKNYINLPETTINLPNNNSFTFGGYKVNIVPDGFAFIVTSIKTIIGIACTILFINGLRKRYDEVMGVET